jgi:NAD(P)-dependent dehydrogenase (short-subunit alcohol dehydrogenase family)
LPPWTSRSPRRCASSHAPSSTAGASSTCGSTPPVHAGPLAPAGHLAVKDLDKSIAINLRATADLIGVLTPLLGPQGRAVFFDDPRAGEKFFGHYGATKAGQIALAALWAAEGERIGPRV